MSEVTVMPVQVEVLVSLISIVRGAPVVRDVEVVARKPDGSFIVAIELNLVDRQSTNRLKSLLKKAVAMYIRLNREGVSHVPRIDLVERIGVPARSTDYRDARWLVTVAVQENKTEGEQNEKRK